MASTDETSMLDKVGVHVNAEPTFDMKTMFLDTLNTLLQEKANNSWIISRYKYCAFIEDVKQAKAKQKKRKC